MSFIARRRFLALAIALFLAGPAVGAPAKIVLSDQDKADIARAEAFLNSFTTMKARFLQVAPNGMPSEGTVFFSRPGRMRLQYDPPSPMLVVADGSFLIVHDKELDAPSYIPLGSTPAGILVRDHVRLDDKDVAVLKVGRAPGILTVTMVQADDPAQGQLTLVFSERPFALKQWRVLDPQGNITQVSLFDTQIGLGLDRKLFEFVDPNFAKPKLNDG